MYLGMANENEVQPWLEQDSLALNPPFHNIPNIENISFQIMILIYIDHLRIMLRNLS